MGASIAVSGVPMVDCTGTGAGLGHQQYFPRISRQPELNCLVRLENRERVGEYWLEVQGAEPAEGALDGKGRASGAFEGYLLVVEDLGRKVGPGVGVRDANDDNRRAWGGNGDRLLDRRRVA